ncbi:MAG: SGNH/GDSL hydrolase family protein [Clostridia bacterium]|nr:SGNH/GDSL hydrolase family protein [Clostridia bacterium]
MKFNSVKRIICVLTSSLMLACLLSGCMKDGENGLSAYELAVKNGTTTAKSEAEWLASLQGKDGKDGASGRSAYELAVEAGFNGTLDEWLASLKGADGADGKAGKSAYEIAAANGYTGSEAEWIAELLGSREESGTGSGVGISSVLVNADKHLIVRLTNGTVIDAGYVGVSGSTENGGTQTGGVDSDGYQIVNQTVSIIAGALNIRSTPDSTVSTNIVISLQMGTELNRIGIGTGDNTWSKVMYNGQVCYASSKYLEVKSSADVDLTGVEIPPVNLADEYKLLVGNETCFEADQIAVGLADDMYTCFSYSGSGTKRITARSITITPTSAETATLTFSIKKYVDGELVVIYSKAVRLVSVAASNVSVTGLVVGDSRIADGTLVDSLKTRFGSSLTLIGTLKTGSGNAHEGRGSWSTSNYLSYASAVGMNNPFYNSTTKKFDFGYYLTSNSLSSPDFVLFYLGANDGYSALSVLNYGEIISSIQAYNKANSKQVKILIMHEYLAPVDGFSVSYAFDAAQRRDEQFTYFDRLSTAFGGRESEGIYLIPAHTCINGTDDRIQTDGAISDVIHLSKNGYRKQADIVSAYIYAIFSVK